MLLRSPHKLFIAVYSVIVGTVLSSAAANGLSNTLPAGKFANCSEASDAGLRAYQPSQLGATLAGDTLTLEFLVSQFQCNAKDGNTFSWNFSEHPSEPFSTTDIYRRAITILTSAPEIILARGPGFAAGSPILASVPLEDSSATQVRVDLRLSQLLPPKDLAAFDAGEAVPVAANLSQRAAVTVQTSEGKMIPLGLRSGAVFVFSATLKKGQSAPIFSQK